MSLDPQFAQALDDLIEDELARRRDTVAATLSFAEAAEALGVSARTVYRRASAGKIRSVVVCGLLRIPASEVERIRSGMSDRLDSSVTNA